MMEQVFLWNDDQEAGGNKTGIESQQKCHVIFPKLKEVWLHDLPNLTTFYQGIDGIEFPLLKKMKIKECPNWKNIIIGSSSVDIDDDHSLHLLCQPQKISFGSLKSLSLNHNPLCGHEIPSSLFNRLEVLTINKCVGSMSLLTLSMAANLISLRQLYIFNCEEMIKVIADEQHQQRNILVFPKLEILTLKYLPKLVSFCDSKCEVELPLLREVEIEKCPNMENFSLGSVATSKLEAFTTDLTTYEGVGVDVAFNSLKKLKIFENKSPWYDDKISVSLFNGLEELRFSYYKGSMSLFSSSAVGNLVNLRVLQIDHFDEMLVNVIKDKEEKITYSDEMLVKVIEDKEEKEDGEVVSSVEIITSVVIFPKLEELILWDLPKLVRFCELKCDVQLPSLRQVEIVDCPNMESFSMGFVAAPNLKTVIIDDEEIGGTKDLNETLQQHYLGRLEKEKEKEEEEEEKEEKEEEEVVVEVTEEKEAATQG